MPRPDEGLIHTWLDGELNAEEAARVEALMRDDPEWAAAAAEARGFIAASSRIAGMLDDVPANVVPIRKAPVRGAPWWAARIAALAVVAAGTVLVVQRISPDQPVIGTVIVVPEHAPPLRRDRAETDKVTGLDEKRAIVKDRKDSAGQLASGTIKKEVATGATKDAAKLSPAAPQLVAAAPPAAFAPAGGAAGARAKTMNELSPAECYREPRAAADSAPIIHRVIRATDTTAADGVSMRVHGDTLFIGAVNGVARIAIRISCPPK